MFSNMSRVAKSSLKISNLGLRSIHTINNDSKIILESSSKSVLETPKASVHTYRYCIHTQCIYNIFCECNSFEIYNISIVCYACYIYLTLNTL